jgi:hypothetical protein
MSDENHDLEIARLKARLAELERSKTPTQQLGFKRGFFGCLGVGVAIVFVSVVVSFLGSIRSTPSAPANSTPSHTSTAAPARVDKSPPSQAATDSPPATEVHWRYSEDKDALTGHTTKIACTTSTNEIHLDFPYHDVTAQICIRNSPRFGRDIYFTLNGDGQILCNFMGCTIKASFDHGPVLTFSAVEASDHSSNIIFIQGYARFLKELKKSKVAVIEVNFYRAGAQNISFDTSGLNWQ